MADYNIQPFYESGLSSFPLSDSPYNSRVEKQELILDEYAPKNYQFIAFRPGFPLQASELNEIQEHFQMQLTLSITMMHNWITSGVGRQWGSYDMNNSGGEGSEEVPTDVPNNGIGVGGLAPTGELGDSNYAISGPGWRGSCPLHPYHTPYNPGDIANNGPVTVEYSNSGGGTARLNFWSGWWLVELTDAWTAGNDGPTGVSGMKHWVYLSSSDPTVPAFTTTVSMNPDEGNIEKVVGFRLNSDYYSCEPCNGDPLCKEDPELADNSAGFANSVACGASRYGIVFDSIGQASPDSNGDWTNTIESRQRLSLVCKVNPAEGTVRYMNNLVLYQR
jgi:hypothetical protein